MIGKFILWLIIGIFIDALLVSVVSENSVAVAIISYIVGFFVCFVFAITNREG